VTLTAQRFSDERLQSVAAVVEGVLCDSAAAASIVQEKSS